VLASGATEADVSPGGCVRYIREIVNGVTTDESLMVAGRPVIVWRHESDHSTGLQDADGDGFSEWRATVERTGGNDGIWQETLSDPISGGPIQRITYSVVGDTVHVLVEIADEDGTLAPDLEYDTSTVAVAGDSRSHRPAALPAVARTGFPFLCGDVKEAEIRKRLREGIDEGLQCLHSAGATDLERSVTWHYMNDTIDVACYESQDDVWAGIKTWVPFLNVRSLEVNRTNYDTALPSYQRRVLWHEILHVPLGSHMKHDEINSSNSFAGKFDRVYACEELCYGSQPDRCICARCLGTDVCDPRCQKYNPCNTNEGALCLCPSRQKYYPDRTTCAVECPKGLACAFAGCKTLKDLECK